MLEVFAGAAALAGVRLAERRLAKGEPLFDAGRVVGGIHVMRSGLTASRLLLENGREVLIGLHGRGDTLGDLEYCMGGPAVCGVTALEPSATAWADAAALDRMVSADPRLPMALASILAVRLHRSSQRLSAGVAYPLEYSLLKAVLARLDCSDGSRPLSRRDLAEYLGHTERHVNRLLRSLEGSGLLAIADGIISVADPVLVRRRLERLER